MTFIRHYWLDILRSGRQIICIKKAKNIPNFNVIKQKSLPNKANSSGNVLLQNKKKKVPELKTNSEDVYHN